MTMLSIKIDVGVAFY